MTLVVKGVPARVCPNCGEEDVREDITDRPLAPPRKRPGESPRRADAADGTGSPRVSAQHCNPLPPEVTFGVGKIRRGNYIFRTSIGDHRPRHVHVYKESKLVLKWDLETDRPMKGRPNTRLLAFIDQLKREGKL